MVLLQICGKSNSVGHLSCTAPGMETLIIVEPNDKNLSQMSRFLHLTAFHVSGLDLEGTTFNLSCLPAHLKILELQNIQFKLDKLESLRCIEIARASLVCLTACIDNLCQLMQQLPNLQVGRGSLYVTYLETVYVRRRSLPTFLKARRLAQYILLLAVNLCCLACEDDLRGCNDLSGNTFCFRMQRSSQQSGVRMQANTVNQ